MDDPQPAEKDPAEPIKKSARIGWRGQAHHDAGLADGHNGSAGVIHGVWATSRRFFLRQATLGIAAWPFLGQAGFAADAIAALPSGAGPVPLDAAWFPSRLHAFVWRNWSLVSLKRMAVVVGAEAEDIAKIGRSMGLGPSAGLSDAQWRRSYLTIIRRNWHLLPYDQILTLLDWTAERLEYTLREDDFFFIKVGSLKPKSLPLRYSAPTAEETARAAEIRNIVQQHFPNGALEGNDPLFSFIGKLEAPPAAPENPDSGRSAGPLRMGYSYFAQCGDPLLDPSLDPYPDGLLARLAAAGENAVWLHVELGHLAMVPWAANAQIEQRREGLRGLVARGARHGMKIFLYFNEPRSLPAVSPVFDQHPEWRGAAEGDYNAVCTSAPGVRAALRDAVADLCRAVPDLGGFFTITASENLTNCWSHGQGA